MRQNLESFQYDNDNVWTHVLTVTTFQSQTSGRLSSFSSLLLSDESPMLTLEWLLVMIVLNLNSRWFLSPHLLLLHPTELHPSILPYGCGVLLSVRAQ